MKLTTRAFLATLFLLAYCFSSRANDERESTVAAPLEEVLVTGEQPGPGLWKVSKGDHTLWILGVYGPLPKRMIWRSNKAVELVAQSQEMIGWGDVTIGFDSSAGLFGKVKAGAALARFKRNPNDATLSDILAPDVYARWAALKVKYIGRDKNVERLRPLFAAEELANAAVKKAGFTDKQSNAVVSILVDTQNKHHIRGLSPSYKLNFNSKELVGNMKKLPTTQLNDIECFVKTIDGLEEKLQLMRERANAWATGDIDALTHLNRSAPNRECAELFLAVLMGANDPTDNTAVQRLVTQLGKEIATATADVRRNWVALARDALETNVSTFALLPIHELVSPDGSLALLQSNGYTVQEPIPIAD
jgi:hypothetical protein